MKHMPSDAIRRAIVGGGIVLVAGAIWAVLTHRNGSGEKLELLTYRLCIGREQKLCPNDTAFVRNAGEDTAARWAQRECASYKSRRIIINEGPTKDCDCTVADVTCSSE
jgi:hypothetical protein